MLVFILQTWRLLLWLLLVLVLELILQMWRLLLWLLLVLVLELILQMWRLTSAASAGARRA